VGEVLGRTCSGGVVGARRWGSYEASLSNVAYTGLGTGGLMSCFLGPSTCFKPAGRCLNAWLVVLSARCRCGWAMGDIGEIARTEGGDTVSEVVNERVGVHGLLLPDLTRTWWFWFSEDGFGLGGWAAMSLFVLSEYIVVFVKPLKTAYWGTTCLESTLGDWGWLGLCWL